MKGNFGVVITCVGTQSTGRNQISRRHLFPSPHHGHVTRQRDLSRPDPSPSTFSIDPVLVELVTWWEMRSLRERETQVPEV